MTDIPKWVDCKRCLATMCITCAVKNPGSPHLNFADKNRHCDYNKNGICHALACYNSRECTAKDAHGNPKYNDKCEKCGKYLCTCDKE